MSFGILILLAIIQGVTEFLPVSSSGHLVLMYEWFGVECDTMMLSVILHVATLLSVVVYYRKELLLLVRHPLCHTNRKIVVTTIFTCVVVLIFKPIIDKAFEGKLLFVFFLTTAILLIISDYVAERHALLSRTSEKQKPIQTIDGVQKITDVGVNYWQAIVIGIVQGFACLPGISRSGSTIAVSRIMGCKDNARYSFVISIPIIIGSMIMEIVTAGGLSIANVNWWALIVAFGVCFGVGLLCIGLMTRLVAKCKLEIFAYYLIALSIIIIISSCR